MNDDHDIHFSAWEDAVKELTKAEARYIEARERVAETQQRFIGYAVLEMVEHIGEGE